MNEVRIFRREDFSKIKDFQNSKPNEVMGIVYAIEYGDSYSKIGMSSVPAERISVLKHYISDYMQNTVSKIMISKWHTNYRQNEKLLHNEFIDCRIPNTELFSICIEEISDFIVNGGILLEDRSKEILEDIEKTSRNIVGFGKSVMRGDFDIQEERKENFNFAKTYEDMLNSADHLTEEILFTSRGFIDDYRAALDDYAEIELMKIKAYFVDEWIKHGFIKEKQ